MSQISIGLLSNIEYVPMLTSFHPFRPHQVNRMRVLLLLVVFLSACFAAQPGANGSALKPNEDVEEVSKQKIASMKSAGETKSDMTSSDSVQITDQNEKSGAVPSATSDSSGEKPRVLGRSHEYCNRIHQG